MLEVSLYERPERNRVVDLFRHGRPGRGWLVRQNIHRRLSFP